MRPDLLTAVRRTDRRRPPRSGVAAVEFAMVALPFFFLIFAVMQLGLLFLVDAILENATLQAGRLIRTGEAATRNLSAGQFKAELCSKMSVFASECSSRATVEVREIAQFRNQTLPDPVVNGELPTSPPYTNGTTSSLILIRVWYRQPLIAPTMFQAMSRLSSGDTVLSATTAFRSEPY
ncbi:pilus assembly protein [Brevundimonas sp. AJA228-03]|nr:pilus assembly protein [Brevundimonas sp. AJA228-03]